MDYFVYIILLSSLFLFINNLFIKNNILINITGDIHQKFASKLKIPLTGGIFIFLGILFFFNQNFKSFIFFSSLILILGICSDLKLIESAIKRFLFQITLVLSFVIFNDIQIIDTRVVILDKFLQNHIFNNMFVTFCILIVINGSNFLDGLNTLNIGYYLLICFAVFALEINYNISLNEFSIENFLILFSFVFLLNLFNQFYLGDSGSYLLGFIFSILLIYLYNLNNYLSPFFIILLLWYPCYETLFSMIRKKILNRSIMSPDTNHLHQLIFFFVKKKFEIDTIYANIITANIINLYNLLVFSFGIFFAHHSKMQIMLILLNLLIYTVIYFKAFNFKVKKK